MEEIDSQSLAGLSFLEFSPCLMPLEPSKKTPGSESSSSDKIYLSLGDIEKYEYFISEPVFVLITQAKDGKHWIDSLAIAEIWTSPNSKSNTVKCSPMFLSRFQSGPFIDKLSPVDSDGFWGRIVYIIPLWLRIAPILSTGPQILIQTCSLQVLEQSTKESLCKIIEEELYQAPLLYDSLSLESVYNSQAFSFQIKIHQSPVFEGFLKKLRAFYPCPSLKQLILISINAIDLQSFSSETRVLWRNSFTSVFEPAKCLDFIKKAFGSYETQCLALVKAVQACLFESKSEHVSDISRGLVVHGPSGTGKSTLVSQLLIYLSEKVGLFCNSVNLSSVLIGNGPLSDVYRELHTVFQNSLKNSPSVLVLNDLECLVESSDKSLSANKAGLLILVYFLEKLEQASKRVLVIGTTNRWDSVDEKLKKCGAFDFDIEISSPTAPQRKEIIKTLLQREALPETGFSQEDLDALANQTNGFVGSDLVFLIREAFSVFREESTPGTLEKGFILNEAFEELSLQNSGSSQFGLKHFSGLIGKIRPLGLNEWNVQVPNVKWEDVGGQKLAKQKLKEAVEWPIIYPKIFSRMGIKAPKGILLYGPPGNSKTLLVKALATQSHLNFLAVKGPQLLNKWVGESEKSLRQVFKKARDAAPSILFFDEIDAIGGKRESKSESSGNSSGVGERLLTQLLIELDGVQPLSQVIFIGATNNPAALDPALLRPGRIDNKIYIGMPDLETRIEIFQIQSRKMGFDKTLDLASLGEKCGGYSGAEIVALCQQAGLAALDEDFQAQTILERHFYKALQNVKPRTDPKLINYYESFNNNMKAFNK